MPKQLTVRSDIAYETAHALATQMRRPLAEIVETALIEMRSRSVRDFDPSPEIFSTDEIERRRRDLMDVVSRVSANKLPGTGSNHDEFYDENGLPI